MVVGLALASANKRGEEYAGGYIYITDLVASFSLIGNILGIIVVLVGMGLAISGRFSGVAVAIVRSHAIHPLTPCFSYLAPFDPLQLCMRD